MLLGLDGQLSVTVFAPPLLDAFGDPVPGEARKWVVDGCLLAPAGSSGPWDAAENRDRADRVDTTWTLYAPPGSWFPPNAKVVVGGVTANVMGDAEDWPDAGVVVQLRRVEG